MCYLSYNDKFVNHIIFPSFTKIWSPYIVQMGPLSKVGNTGIPYGLTSTIHPSFFYLVYNKGTTEVFKVTEIPSVITVYQHQHINSTLCTTAAGTHLPIICHVNTEFTTQQFSLAKVLPST